MNKEKEQGKFRAIIYTRVSSRGQVEGTSLDTQKESCVAYCKREGMEIDNVFVEEGESGKFKDRTKLKEILEYCRVKNKKKREITHLVVNKLDRYFRNVKEHLLVRAELLAMGITLRSATESIDDTVAGNLQEIILAGFAEYDNKLRKERCVDGMERKLQEGIWCRRPPIGYKTPKKLGAREKKIMPDIPDIETYPAIRKAWKLYLTGNYSIAEVCRKVNKTLPANRKLYTQKLQHILKNKFYYGALVSPFSENEYRGLHQPMITLAEFEDVQRIMKGKGKKIISKKWLNPDFPLRGFVRCATCSRSYTGSWSTARNKQKHPYYHCYKSSCNGTQKYVKKSILEKDFLDYLSRITPKQEFLDDFFKTVVKVAEDKYNQVNADYFRYENQLGKLKKYKNSLIEKNTKGVLPDEDFTESLSKLKLDMEFLEVAMDESKCEIFKEQATLEYARQFVSDLPRQWFDMGIENKRRFQKLLFPEGLPYLGKGKFGTAKMSFIFQINQQFQNKKTNLVGPIGFEPMTKRL